MSQETEIAKRAGWRLTLSARQILREAGHVRIPRLPLSPRKLPLTRLRRQRITVPIWIGGGWQLR